MFLWWINANQNLMTQSRSQRSFWMSDWDKYDREARWNQRGGEGWGLWVLGLADHGGDDVVHSSGGADGKRKISRWGQNIHAAGQDLLEKSRFEGGDLGVNWIHSPQVYQAVIRSWLWNGLSNMHKLHSQLWFQDGLWLADNELGTAMPEDPPQIL